MGDAPIFDALRQRYSPPADRLETQEEFAVNAPMRGFFAFLDMAEVISGKPVTGAEYLAMIERGRIARERQAKLRIQRGEPPYGTITYYLNSENKETIS